jgi:putative hydrolase of the HAD superfamily
MRPWPPVSSSTCRAVLFDAVGTLIYPDPPVAVAYAAAGRRFGSRLDEHEVRRRFKLAFARQEALDAAEYCQQTSDARERARWQAIVSEVFDDVADGESLFFNLWRHFAHPDHWRVFNDVPDFWSALEARKLIIGIASNFDGRLRDLCQGQPPLDRCRKLFVSSALGWRKPSPQFFRAIEQSLGFAANQILLVGDDRQADFEAALAAGWQAALVER